MPVTTPELPLLSTAVAVAAVVGVPPPVIVTVGATEYTEVPGLILKIWTVRPRLAVAVAPEPTPGLSDVMVTVGTAV